MNKVRLFLVSLVLLVFTGYAGSCKPVVGCKPLCKNKDGSLDITFGDHGTVVTDIAANDFARGVVIQPCGRIVAVGYSQSGIAPFDFALTRYTSYGVLDTSFGPNGTGIVLTDFATVLNNVGGSYPAPSNDQAYAVALQKNCDGCDYVCGDKCFVDCDKDGKLVVVGTSNVIGGQFHIAVARYNGDGSLDTTFGLNNSGVQVVAVGDTSSAHAVAIQEDNKIVIAGEVTTEFNSNFVLVRLNCDGSLDTTFGCNENGIVITNFDGFTTVAYAVKIQKDGKIILAGELFHVDGTSSFSLARYHSNGRLDRSFGPDHNGKVVTTFPESILNTAQALVILEDCGVACGCEDNFRIVAIGFIRDSDRNKIALAGYTANGCLDKNFGLSGTGLVLTSFTNSFNSTARAAVLQRDCGKACKIIVAGGLNTLDTPTTFMLARYDANGVLDKEFGSDGKVTTAIQQNSQAFAVALQDNGGIVAVGQCNQLTTNFALARYNQCENCACSCLKSDCVAC